MWPPSLDYMMKYIAYLSKNNYASSTCRSYISGLSFKLKAENFEDITQSFLIKKILTGFDRLYSRPDIRQPITAEMMTKMPNALLRVCFSNYESYLFWAAFSLAFGAFLRVGEITIRSVNDMGYVLQKDDVTMDFNKNVIYVTIRFSKTDQRGLTTTLALKSNSSLMSALSNYNSARPKQNGPYFCHLDGKAMTRYQFHSILTKTLQFLDYDVKRFNTHSFRIGAATHAFLNGKSEEEIKNMGRWRSSSFKRYIRIN